MPNSSSSSFIQYLKTSILFIVLAYCLYILCQINSKPTNCNCHVTTNQFECRCRCRSSTSCNSNSSLNGGNSLTSNILEDSEYNWVKFVRQREQNLIKFGDVYKKNIFGFSNLASIWDIFQPYYACPWYKEVCGVDRMAQKPSPCIVYSYGVSNEYSFEKEILSRTNCLVFMYDHTINPQVVQPLLDQYKGRVVFKPFGIGPFNTDKLHTLKSEMDSNGHQFVDIVKMDVEGNEYKIFDQLIQDFSHGFPFGQLQIELHIFSKYFFESFVNFWRQVEKAGLRAFHTEPNNHYYQSVRTVRKTGAHNCAEYSFINVKVDNYLINSDF